MSWFFLALTFWLLNIIYSYICCYICGIKNIQSLPSGETKLIIIHPLHKDWCFKPLENPMHIKHYFDSQFTMSELEIQTWNTVNRLPKIHSIQRSHYQTPTASHRHQLPTRLSSIYQTLGLFSSISAFIWGNYLNFNCTFWGSGE